MKKIQHLFSFFKDQVVADKNVSHDTVLSAFVEFVLRQEEILLPLNPETFAKFERDVSALSKKEKALLHTRADELHDARTRRIAGQFYTPVEFVELAHELMDVRLGADWRENYIVWDAAAGSLNLTRGYPFKELYSSTLQQEEVDRNPVGDPATESFFQFDFLSGDLSKLPKGLRHALEMDKPILFFMNPPYSTGAKERIEFGTKTKFLTHVQVQSRRMGLSTTAKDLYAQFMLRIMLLVRHYKLTRVVYAVFSPLTFLSSDNLKTFRKRWCDIFCFDRGILFDAGHFSGTALNWAIQFSIWKQGEKSQTSGFKYFIVEKDKSGGIVKTGTKYVHNLDMPHPQFKRLTPDWLASPVTLPTRFLPGVTTSFEVVNSVKEGFDGTNRVSADHLGKLCYDPPMTVFGAGNAYGRPGYIINTTTVGNLEITPRNFERVMALLATARSLDKSFVDQKDYMYTPNESLPEWQRYVSDAVVFGLVSNGSSHISRYDVEWYGQRYQLPNEFFWMTSSAIRDYAERYHDKKALYSLEISPNERFAAKWLCLSGPRALSPEATAVLDFVTDLTHDTFQERAEFDKARPEIQICNWDAGWWQLKELWKIVAKEKFKELVRLRNELSASLRSRIRLLGWLRPRDS